MASRQRGVSLLTAQWRHTMGASRCFASAADVPQGHDPATLTGDKCNIGLKRRVDISLRQDLALAAARTWDQGVDGGFAASTLAHLFKVGSTWHAPGSTQRGFAVSPFEPDPTAAPNHARRAPETLRSAPNL
jgi:hypothetical protein